MRLKKLMLILSLAISAIPAVAWTQPFALATVGGARCQCR